MSISTSCPVIWDGEPGAATPFGHYNDYEDLPFRGFAQGDRVIRDDDPIVGTLEHICRETERSRIYHYAWVLWPIGRRGEKYFDVHRHSYLFKIRHATEENIAIAESIVAEKLHRAALRYNLVVPRD